MLNAIGKTIARLEQDPVDEDGYTDYDILLIHFDDGTALKLEAMGYETSGIEAEVIDLAAVTKYAVNGAVKAAKEEAKAAERAAWMALSCDERCRRNAYKRSLAPPPNPIVRSFFASAWEDMIRDQNRMLMWGSGGRPAYDKKHPCPDCKEAECATGAWVEHVPAGPEPRYVPCDGRTVTIPIKARQT